MPVLNAVMTFQRRVGEQLVTPPVRAVAAVMQEFGILLIGRSQPVDSA